VLDIEDEAHDTMTLEMTVRHAVERGDERLEVILAAVPHHESERGEHDDGADCEQDEHCVPSAGHREPREREE
jgi:hypothetical protein